MTAALAVEALTLRYGGVTALDDVTLTVAPRERVGLVGPNGAGKTSLLDCVSGVVRPSSGRVVVGGRDVTALRAAARARLGVARTLQGLGLVDSLDVLGNLLLGHGALRERCAEVAAALGLDPWARAAGLGAGARKRLELGRALAMDGSVLLLDEPFAGAEAADVDLMVAAIRRSPAAALIVDHDLDTVMGMTDRLVTLEAGHARSAAA